MYKIENGIDFCIVVAAVTLRCGDAIEGATKIRLNFISVPEFENEN
jgi:hypothetical protein